MEKHFVFFKVETKPEVKPCKLFFDGKMKAESINELRIKMNNMYNYLKDECNVYFYDYSCINIVYDLFDIGLLEDLDGELRPNQSNIT